MDKLIHVGFEKGEADFGVSGAITTLTPEQYKEIRNMTIVAIGTMEDMWRRAQESKNPAQQVTKPL